MPTKASPVTRIADGGKGLDTKEECVAKCARLRALDAVAAQKIQQGKQQVEQNVPAEDKTQHRRP
jgi:hypothetical protein